MSQRHIRVFVRVYKTGSIKEMTYPINAIIFDIDGVLLDSLFIWKELGRRFIVKHGYTPVPDMDEILFSMSMEQGAAWLKDTFSLENSEEENQRLKSELKKLEVQMTDLCEKSTK